MTTLSQLQERLDRALATLSEGWNQLRERTAYALTSFHPVRAGADIETSEDVIVRRCARRGLIPAEVVEEEQDLQVRLEIPGMERNDFDLEVVGDVLVVRGEKRVRRERETGRYYLLECAYGGFERAAPLPVPMQESRARASYHKGIRSIVLPKASAAGIRRIPVHSE